MTTKERLAYGERILCSIDARRKSTKNPHDLLPLEQAIVDRELLELDSEPIASEKGPVETQSWTEKRRAVSRPPPEK